MPDIQIVGPSYPAPSIYQDAQECINWRPEIDPTLPEGSRNIVALYPTPGLTLIAQFFNQQEVRSVRAVSGGEFMLAVCGALVFVLNQNLTTNYMIGVLSTSSGPLDIRDNGTYAYFTDGPNRYAWLINDGSRVELFGSFSGNTLTVSQVLSGQITANMVLLGLDVPVDTYIVSGSGNTWTLNRSVSVIGVVRLFCNQSASVFNNSFISGNRLFVGTGNDFVSGKIALGQRLYTPNITPNTIVTATGAEDNQLTGEGMSGTYTVNNSNPQGTIIGCARASAGSGYTSLPTIALDSPINILGEQAIVVVNSLEVVSANVANAGSGYAVNQVFISIGGQFESPFVFRVSTVNASGGITGIVIVNAGKFTVVPTNPVRIYNSTSAGTGATLTLSFGIANDFTVMNNGSGYTQINPSATVTGGGGAGATVTLQYGGAIVPSNFSGYSFTQMPTNDGAFVGGIGLAIIDNYFVYAEPNSQRFASTDAGKSPITNALSFGIKDGLPDDVISIWPNNRQLHVIGERSSEVWVNTGTVPFPFQRLPSAASQEGCAAPYTVARLGNSLAYVSRNNRGQGQVVYLEGYTPVRISNHAVENSIANADLTDSRAFTYQLEGHEVYCLTIPSIDTTWCYDLATQMWHKWMRWDADNSIFRRCRANFATQFNGRIIVGDFENGKLYYLDNDNPTFDGELIHRLRRVPHIVADYTQTYFKELRIYFEPATGRYLPREPQAMLRWSNDGGSTWSNEYWTSIGAVGKYNNRAIWRRLGRARDRVFELRVSDPVKWVVISSELALEGGAH